VYAPYVSEKPGEWQEKKKMRTNAKNKTGRKTNHDQKTEDDELVFWIDGAFRTGRILQGEYPEQITRSGNLREPKPGRQAAKGDSG
jgi:hypothetical protein